MNNKIFLFYHLYDAAIAMCLHSEDMAYRLKKGGGKMEAEEIWKRFQKHMGYTDQEMGTFRSDPEKVKMVTHAFVTAKST